MRKNLFIKTVSQVLIITLLLTIFPLDIIARADSSNSSGNRQRTVVKELVEKRTEYQKEFLNSDGTHTIKLYNTPIHYKNGDTYEDIDNTLVTNNNLDTKDNYDIKNKANKIKTVFSTPKDKRQFTEVQDGKYSLQLVPQNAKKNDALLKDKSITYPNIYNDIDLKYDPVNDGVKESIIINKPTDKTTYTFELALNNLIPKRNEDGTIGLYDSQTEEPVLFIPMPFAEDANGNYCGDVTQDIRNVGGKYYLDIQIDGTWLESPDRQYPIIIDPSVTETGTTSNSYDTYVLSAYPTTKYYSQGKLMTGYSSSTGTCKSFIKYNILQRVPGVINSVTFNAYCYSNYSGSPSEQIYEITSNWSDTTVDWNHQPAYSNNIYNRAVSGPGWYSWNITGLYKAWLSGRPDYGIALKMNDSDSSAGYYRSFYDNLSTSYSHYLSIDYTPLSTPTLSTNSVVSPYKNNSNGVLSASWTALSGASGYYISIYNGHNFQDFSTGSSTSWTSAGKGMYPANISSGGWQFVTNGTGAELSCDPRNLYTNAWNANTDNEGTDYRANLIYAVRLRTAQTFTFAGSNYTLLSDYSGANHATLPDTIPPNPALGIGLTLQDSGPNTGDAWKVTASWTAATDLPQGGASGIGSYMVNLYNITNGQVDYQATVPSTQTSYTFPNVKDSCTFRADVYAYDVNGNSKLSSSNSIVTADRTAPTPPTSVAINPSSWTNNTSPTISWAGITDAVGIQKVQYSIDGGAWVDTGLNTGSGSKSISCSNLADGTHTIAIRGTDAAGNIGSSKSATYYKDMTLPVISITTPVNNSFISGMTNITGTASDDHISNWEIEYGTGTNPSDWTVIATGTSSINNGTFTSFDTGPLLVGSTYTLRLTVTDLAGNTKTASVIVTKDNSDPPATNITSPGDNSYLCGNVNIIGTANDTNFKQYKLEYALVSAPDTWTQIGAAHTIPINDGILDTIDTTLIPDGTYNIKVTAWDNNNLSSSYTVSDIVIDNNSEPDKTQITSPRTDDLVDGNVKIIGTADETNFGNAVLEYGAGSDPTSWTQINTLTAPIEDGLLSNWQVSGLNPGRYTIRLTVYDKTGHTSSKTVTVTIPDRQIPYNLGTDDYYPTAQVSNGEVNTATGNFILNETDLSVNKGRGPALSVERTYNSYNKTLGLLGWGWSINIPKLIENSDSSVDIVDVDGSRLHFNYNGSMYTAPFGHYETLSKDDTGVYTLNYKGGSRTTFDNVNGKVYIKDNNNNTLAYSVSADSISITDAAGRSITLDIDTAYNRIYKVTDFENRVWKYDYDESGNLSQVTYPDNSYSTYGYGNSHNLVSITNPLENYKHDSDENYTPKVEHISYGQYGKLSNITDESGISTNITYDAANKETTVSYADGTADNNKWVYDYNDNNLLVKETDPLGRSTEYQYNDSNNPTLPTTMTEACGTADEAVTNYTYDSHGNTLSITDPMNNTMTYTYENDMVKTIDGSNTTYTYDDRYNVVSDGSNTYAYDPVSGLLLSKTDKNGNVTRYDYDSNGYNTSVTVTSSNGTDSNTLQKTSYDNLGQAVSSTSGGRTTQYTYTINGQIETATETADGADQVTSYTYDKNGNMLTSTSPNGDVTSYEYDLSGKVTLINHPDNTQESYSYDSMGRVKAYTDQKGNVTSYEYDKAGNTTKVTVHNQADNTNTVTTCTYDNRNNKLTAADNSGTIEYSYDKNNNLVSEIKKDTQGNVISTANSVYDKYNKLTGKTVDSNSAHYNYDGGQKLTNIHNNENNNDITYSYDDNSNRTGIAYGNGTSVSIGYTAAGNISSIQNKAPNGSVISGYDYTYYDNAKVQTINDGSSTAQIQYDDLGRVSSVDYGNGHTSSYSYDEMGNRTSSIDDGVTTTYTYYTDQGTDPNQLKSMAKNGVTTSFTYDANGNTKSSDDGTHSTQYTYDAENRLTGIIKDGNNIGYTYDSEDERVTKTINGVTVNYVYSGGLLAAEKDSNGSTIATYLYDDKGQPVSMTRSGVTYYYHYNAHGDTVALTDGSGNVAATYKYDIWGNITSKTGDIENPYTYGGQFGYVFDSESGLYFLMTRYYNSETGRFISRDRFAGFDNDPSSQNRYVYCGNDPVNNVDPTGYLLIPWQVYFALGTAIAGGIYEMACFIHTNMKLPGKKLVIGAGNALLKGLIKGFIVGGLTVLSKGVIWGVVGGLFQVYFTYEQNHSLKTSTAISAFLNGYSKGVSAKTLNLLLSKIGLRNELAKYAISTLSGYGVGKWLSWSTF